MNIQTICYIKNEQLIQYAISIHTGGQIYLRIKFYCVSYTPCMNSETTSRSPVNTHGAVFRHRGTNE